MTGPKQETPLVYVFLGSTFPRYALFSLKISLQISGFTTIWLITNGGRPEGVPKEVRHMSVEDFYSQTRFNDFQDFSNLSRDFRDGFWMKTTERLFVLESFASHVGLTSFAHCELDVMLMSPMKLIEEAANSGLEGVFAPRETVDRTMASFLFCNSPSALSTILDFFVDNPLVGNEMEMLGEISRRQPQLKLYALASVEALYRKNSGPRIERPWPITGLQSQSIVDGAVLGNWLLGVDPRNTPNNGTVNLVQNPPYTVPFQKPLKELSFRFDKKTWSLEVKNDGDWLTVVALHVHSKVFKRLSARRMLRIISRANRGKQSVIVLPRPTRIFRKARRIAKDLKLFVSNPGFRRLQLERLVGAKRTSPPQSRKRRKTKVVNPPGNLHGTGAQPLSSSFRQKWAKRFALPPD